ncbi:hypothetical protein BDZ94DRAFT_1241879 [Collybia nuda]|uniref:Uncharacterized protein n=1 Tax=Collybia nuda TaxID=64659 RepID=A0A9P6CBE3_9AGAR|nr:hypothetical protein BDZ94DRAFT_1241879 [Collybia nuda]
MGGGALYRGGAVEEGGQARGGGRHCLWQWLVVHGWCGMVGRGGVEVVVGVVLGWAWWCGVERWGRVGSFRGGVALFRSGCDGWRREWHRSEGGVVGGGRCGAIPRGVASFRGGRGGWWVVLCRSGVGVMGIGWCGVVPGRAWWVKVEVVLFWGVSGCKDEKKNIPEMTRALPSSS